MGIFGSALNIVQLEEEHVFRGVVHELGLLVDCFNLLGHFRKRFAMPPAKVSRLAALASPLLRGTCHAPHQSGLAKEFN